MIYIITGKTAAGKKTMMRNMLLENDHFKPLTIYTTRAPKENEINNDKYWFITPDEFFKKKNCGFFVETHEKKTEDGHTYYYGTAGVNPNENYVVVLNIKSVEKYLEKYGANNLFIMNLICPENIRYERSKKQYVSFDENKWQRKKINDTFDYSKDALSRIETRFHTTIYNMLSEYEC